jgi:uncharacterized membrane protein (UPF0127 family)
MRQISIQNKSRRLKKPLTLRHCDSFLCKLRGLSFRSRLPADSGLLMAESKAGRFNTGIHMLGMFFDLSIIWLDDGFKIVDKTLARRWISFVLPRRPARYVIECAVSRYEEFEIGDQLAFKEIAKS